MSNSCDPMDYSPPASSVHRISQARMLEWVAISFSRGSPQPRDRAQVSCTAGGFFTDWATREALLGHIYKWNITLEYEKCSIWAFSAFDPSHPKGLETMHQFSSVTQPCLTLYDPKNRSTPGLPVHHYLLEFTQTHVHRVRDAIQPSHPRSSPSPPAPNPSQHQSLPMSQLFTWSGQSTGVSASASFLPKKSQGWSPSEWTGWISLKSKCKS